MRELKRKGYERYLSRRRKEGPIKGGEGAEGLEGDTAPSRAHERDGTSEGAEVKEREYQGKSGFFHPVLIKLKGEGRGEGRRAKRKGKKRRQETDMREESRPDEYLFRTV